MANQHPNLHRVGRFWHFTLKVGGKRSHGSTRATDLGTAKKVIEEKRRELINGKSREPAEAPTLTKLLEEWFSCHRPSHSVKHCRSVESIAKTWLLPDLGTTRIDEIQARQVLSIRSAVLDAGRSVVTANNVTRTLKLLLGFGVKLGYLEKLPVRLKALRAQRKPRPVLPASRVQEFLLAVDAHTADPQRRCAVRIALGMGLREGEILHMKHCWIDIEKRLYIVGRAKGKESRTVPIPSFVLESIKALPQVSKEWVFAHPKTKQPHNPNFLRGVLDRAGLAIGLPGLSQHRLRASWASWLAEANVPIPEISALMGHKHWAVTQMYVVTTLDAKRNAQDNLSKQLGFT